MKKLISFWKIILLLWIDQISKYFFYNLQKGWELPFIKSAFNKGISRGITFPMDMILILSLICILWICYFYYKKKITKGEFVLFIAWSLGNIIDRIFLWGVRDFIAIGSFPIFNVADILLSCSLILLWIREFCPVFYIKYFRRKRK